MTTAGVRTEFAGLTADPGSICVGPDGNIWFTEPGSRIGRLTPSGSLAEFTLPSQTNPSIGVGICAGPDGAVWFGASNALGRVTTGGQFSFFPYTGATVFANAL